MLWHGLLVAILTISASSMSLNFHRYDASTMPFLQDRLIVDSHPSKLGGSAIEYDLGPWGCLYALWAYPIDRPSDHAVHIRTTVPALVTYILGPTWRSHLEEAGGKQLKRPDHNWTQEDEDSLAKRMLRAGGGYLNIRHIGGHIYDLDDLSKHDWAMGIGASQKYVFGWPGDGGVWVLALPLRLREQSKTRDERGAWSDMEESRAMRSGDAITWATFCHGGVYLESLKDVETMEEYCERLKELGARFYADPSESAEAQYASIDSLTTLV
ncbi:hypothetical protein BU16DRAFT_621959 [Lophium mytilinum]|uniref:Uncharacterized protein n=1 Tax=Lophium mytilinum TaxID=390894 RepID=A0A6A6QDW0_9PEZI|nr:hypothetical protein BU16DRAFT_621959 [Lophium mytilinum]